MAVTSFQDLELADEDREWDGNAAEKRVRKWAGVNIRERDVNRVKSHLAKYYKKINRTPPWDD
jgi:hypothetical protein